MSAYPMMVEKISTDHHGGTKSYHFILIHTADNKGLVVFRYGKKGQIGTIEAHQFNTRTEADKAHAKKFREKAGRGYQQSSTDSAVINNLAELRQYLSVVYPKLGAEAIAHIDPTADVSGLRQAEPPEYDEDGRKIARQPRKADISAQLAQQAAEEKQQSAAALANNPNFGRF